MIEKTDKRQRSLMVAPRKAFDNNGMLGKAPYALHFAVLRAISDDCILPVSIRAHIGEQFGSEPEVQATATRMNWMKNKDWILRHEKTWSLAPAGEAKLTDHLNDFSTKNFIELSNDKLRKLVLEALAGSPGSARDIVLCVNALTGASLRSTRIHKAIYDLKHSGEIQKTASVYRIV
ncbi:MAG: hypothetical protein JKY49_16950 [Cohaesibacteraceae bacterium]|nr:hypothetical protein [Cohaesibacteraceae bacterium]